jgi:hypothetical protein
MNRYINSFINPIIEEYVTDDSTGDIIFMDHAVVIFKSTELKKEAESEEEETPPVLEISWHHRPGAAYY